MLAWLARHPRFVFHFTPTSCSWLNAVETFFATLTKRRLKRVVFRSVVDLQAAINRYLDEANHDPKPFLWTAHPDKIIAAVNRGRQALNRSTSASATVSRRAQSGKLMLQVVRPSGEGSVNVVAELEQRVDRHRRQVRRSSHMILLT